MAWRGEVSADLGADSGWKSGGATPGYRQGECTAGDVGSVRKADRPQHDLLTRFAEVVAASGPLSHFCRQGATSCFLVRTQVLSRSSMIPVPAKRRQVPARESVARSARTRCLARNFRLSEEPQSPDPLGAHPSAHPRREHSSSFAEEGERSGQGQGSERIERITARSFYRCLNQKSISRQLRGRWPRLAPNSWW